MEIIKLLGRCSSILYLNVGVGSARREAVISTYVVAPCCLWGAGAYPCSLRYQHFFVQVASVIEERPTMV